MASSVKPPSKKWPACSPFLNAIENYFTVFKLKFRETLCEPQIVQLLAVVLHGITITERRLRALRTTLGHHHPGRSGNHKRPKSEGHAQSCDDLHASVCKATKYSKIKYSFLI